MERSCYKDRKSILSSLEVQKIKEQLSRQGIEILRRWAMEDGELTPKQAKSWPMSVLRVNAVRNNWYNRIKSWLQKQWRHFLWHLH